MIIHESAGGHLIRNITVAPHFTDPEGKEDLIERRAGGRIEHAAMAAEAAGFVLPDRFQSTSKNLYLFKLSFNQCPNYMIPFTTVYFNYCPSKRINKLSYFTTFQCHLII